MLDKKSNFKAWLYLAPALILLSLFTFYPIINAFFLSILKGYNFLDRSQPVSIDLTGNFIGVVRSADFRQAMKNTLIIVFVSVPVSITVALLISVALNSIKKLQGVFQTIFFLPYVTNSIAIGMTFAFIFSSEPYGLVNSMLDLVGLEPKLWMNSWETGMIALLVYTVWGGLAFKIMVFLSGLQGIDKQYYDAAKVDATPRGRIFTKITVPLLSPMIAYITITSFIGAFKAYQTVVGMFGADLTPTGELPTNSMITLVGLVYKALTNADAVGQVSIAAAASLILFAITLAFTGIQMWVSKKRVHY